MMGFSLPSFLPKIRYAFSDLLFYMVNKVYTSGWISFLKCKFYGKRGKLCRRRLGCEIQARLSISKTEFRDKSEHIPLTCSFADNLTGEFQAIT